MTPTAELLRKIDGICARDHRYKSEAYLFVLAGLHDTVGRLAEPRHLTGQELAEGLRIYGLDQFGPLTAQVFEHWGVRATEDFGHIVFLLVNARLLRKTEEDSLSDFVDLYDFAEAFNPHHLYTLADES
ncbi:MAG: hypothetical protein HYZ94_00210 [Candidatus Omnitrophica bacterium]|nr:hypothetical protein [Candidatus Omnitrophota bacterium]